MAFMILLMALMVGAWALGILNQMFWDSRTVDDVAAGTLIGTSVVYVSLLLYGVLQ